MDCAIYIIYSYFGYGFFGIIDMPLSKYSAAVLWQIHGCLC